MAIRTTRTRRRLLTTGSLVVAVLLGVQGTAFAVDNLPPDQPVAGDLHTDSKACATGDDRAHVAQAPRLSAVLHDTEEDDRPQPDLVKPEFEAWWQDSDGAERRLTYNQASALPPGTPVYWQLPSEIPPNTVVSWRVRANDGRATSPWSDEGTGSVCEFVIDDQTPEKPVISSPEYPDPGPGEVLWTDGVGVYGHFTFASPSDDVVEYRYSFLGGGAGTVRPDRIGGPATVSYLPQKTGPDQVVVRAFDRAGRSAESTYYFYVKAGHGPGAWWKLSDAPGSKTAAPEAGPAARAGSGVTFGASGPAGTDLTSVARLDGTGHGFLTPGTSVVDTEKTFAVGGWVRPAGPDRDMTIVSQDAGTAPGFTLGSRTRDGEPVWSFAFGGAQVSGGNPTAGEWAHVLGLYDAETGRTRLYVNGQETGTEQQAAAVESAGDFQIGRARGKAGYRDRWQGEIGDVRIYDRVVVAKEAAELAHREPGLRGHWSLEAAEDGVSPELYDGAPLKLGGGAKIHRGPDYSVCIPDIDPDCPQVPYALVGDGDLELDGQTGYAATDEPVVDTGDSFTVGVVVRLADSEPEGPMTVLSQGGAHGDAFKLRYFPSTYTWQLVVSDGDREEATETIVGENTLPDEAQRLAVVYDDETDQIKLWVNGHNQPDATATFRDSWQSTGGLQIGRAHTGSGWGEYLHGSVDEVHAFAGVLDTTSIRQLGSGIEPCLCG
ncbi:LamG domain-containing protein [Streptomyces sp. AK02-01A]|uniref:LamG domain-containing protein n=1 Tax=Streptomyces sp. AK02-01A TaxID=3028648 RepID=UPI0029A47E0E|nr:LamG domain-containing protein [Streptomyces sp. AK02-01A]MDX3851775.1 LamG domain-containing protein [Streptomyces sp. AK02-01A]